MKYIRILTAFCNAIWAIQEEKYLQMREFLLFKASGGDYSAEEVRQQIGAKVERKSAQNQPALAVIPIHGVISQRMNLMDDISGPGAASTERIARDFDIAMKDKDVAGILLDVDSPGGTVFGVPELAEKIRAGRGKKPIVASVNSLAASAAYWIAASADEIVMTPSGQAGSIGVFSEHLDISKALEQKGIKPTLIAAGKYKVEGNPYEVLGDEARKYIQGQVDEYYAMFVDGLAQARSRSAKQIREEFGQGRVFGSKQALQARMVDRVETFDKTVQTMTGSGATAVLVWPADLASSEQDAAVLKSLASVVEGDGTGRMLPEIIEGQEDQVRVGYHSGPIAPHKSATTDGTWDGPANEARLPSPMTLQTARNTYAWMEDDAEQDGKIRKEECRFIHHEVSGDGSPGAANLTACSSAIGVLNGGRGGTTIPREDRQGVYDHLAKHLRDGDREPPELAEEIQGPSRAQLAYQKAKLMNEFDL